MRKTSSNISFLTKKNFNDVTKNGVLDIPFEVNEILKVEKALKNFITIKEILSFDSINSSMKLGIDCRSGSVFILCDEKENFDVSDEFDKNYAARLIWLLSDIKKKYKSFKIQDYIVIKNPWKVTNGKKTWFFKTLVDALNHRDYLEESEDYGYWDFLTGGFVNPGISISCLEEEQNEKDLILENSYLHNEDAFFTFPNNPEPKFKNYGDWLLEAGELNLGFLDEIDDFEVSAIEMTNEQFFQENPDYINDGSDDPSPFFFEDGVNDINLPKNYFGFNEDPMDAFLEKFFNQIYFEGKTLIDVI